MKLLMVDMIGLDPVEIWILMLVKKSGSFSVSIPPTLGDINEDQLINILDVILLVSVILDGEYIQSGDLNSDGSVDVLDIVSIVNIILGGDNE